MNATPKKASELPLHRQVEKQDLLPPFAIGLREHSSVRAVDHAAAFAVMDPGFADAVGDKHGRGDGPRPRAKVILGAASQNEKFSIDRGPPASHNVKA